uniref:CMP/dCMP deaminase zinc-binding n=2 Tax=Candidatus Bipolaricaulota TaxID=67810 RepID=H5SDK5_9BACT|nr:CMP/dCMP deaminase zinc-binding [uncultured Acetothermia bacterium]BAL60271.1 CMP/dCMP deaminase zinc-binding [Candidatus Acetothermum autotrophicum]
MRVTIEYPAWVAQKIDWERRYSSPEERMRLAIDLARENVVHKTGGPFGAAVFERQTGRLISVGVNLVVSLKNALLHAEIVALMMAHQRLRSFTLSADPQVQYELVTSCEPCALCLGAIFASKVRRVLCGASRDDAMQIGFDEGPVFPESYEYLEARGIEFVRHLCRAEAKAILDLYAQHGGIIY